MREWVVDASVVVKLFIADDHTPRARALFAMLLASPPAIFHAPDLLYSEVAGVLRKHALAGYPHARRDTLRLRDIQFRVTPCRDLVTDAVGISLDRVISSYDAFYVALSRRVSAPLITADERLFRALAGLMGYDVRSLAEIDLDRRGAPS
jgi:predicted nucleic acid-binding protein